MKDDFQLLLFSTDPDLIRRAHRAGVSGIIVDWENIGKRFRQRKADTEINSHDVADLRRVRKAMDELVICRVNHFGLWSKNEIENAVAAGADEILLPMVRTVQEVETVLSLVSGRCGVGILIETLDGMRVARELSQLPLTRMYIGLNDLAIERGMQNIFTALVDGTVDQIICDSIPCRGFGGLTVPERGYPIPCRLLISEMARLNCRFSFLRRSFHRDIRDIPVEEAIPKILRAVKKAGRMSDEYFTKNQAELEALVVQGTGVTPSIAK